MKSPEKPKTRRRRSASLPGAFKAIGRQRRAGSTSGRGRSRKRNWRLRVLIGLPLIALATAASAFAVLIIYYTIAFPHPLAARNSEQSPIVRILARDGTVIASRGANSDYMPLDLLPNHVLNAVIATEDRRFFEHYGVDPFGLIRALFANIRAGRFAQGGSTLSQQLAKNLFLSPERTLSRKLEELALALWLEIRLSKREILEIYLNRVYFGGGAYGIEAASRRYFDKSARELTIAEAALIAGLLRAPSKYSPAVSPGAARSRGRVVIAKMAEAGVIDARAEKAALAERIEFASAIGAANGSGIEYAIDYVLEQMPPIAGGDQPELIVETTLDISLQRRVNTIVARHMAKGGPPLGVSQAAVAVLDTNGGIRALIGGKNYRESQFNRAVKAKRQPGSAFKPFVYLAALEKGMSPDTVILDVPFIVDGWAPRNENGSYQGEITLRRAIAQSVNTVAARLNQTVGKGTTSAVARRLGITSDLTPGPSLALGTSEVSLLELTGAYGAFGNGGNAVDPYVIRRVRMSSGRVIFARDAGRRSPVISAANLGNMNELLNGVVTNGTARKAALTLHPAAGKTGTSQDFRDAWFVGYTSYLTAGVWIGNDDGRPMRKATGGGLPSEIWHDVMTAAHEGRMPAALPQTVTTSRVGQIPSVVALQRMQRDGDGGLLPWLSANAGPQRRGVAGSAYPHNRIDDEFILKALDNSRDVAEPAQPSKSLLPFNWW